MDAKEAVALLDFHVSALMEHYDSVQIMVTRSDHTGTEDFMRGGGNWYARQGMAHDFITRDKARTEAHELSKINNEEPE